MRITYIPRAHRLLVAALALVIVAGAIWGWAGSIPTTAHGAGVIQPGGQQVYAVQGNGSGKVAKIAVEVGDSVTADQIIAEIRQPALDAQISAAKRDLAEAQRESDALKKRLESEQQIREDAAAQELALLSQAIEEAQKTRDRLQRQLGQDEQGSAADPALLEIRQQFEQATARIVDLQIQSSRARSNLSAARAAFADQLETERRDVQNRARAVADLEARRDLLQPVRSPVAGSVREIRTAVGETVEPQDILVTVASFGSGFEVLAFLVPEDAPRATAGMKVHVSPATVKEAEFGTMQGEITSISDAAVSVQAINELLRDPELAESFTDRGDPYLARIRLFENPENPSGFEWWSGGGAPFKVSAGTLATVDVVLSEQPPISLVLPALRELLGL